MDTEIKLKLWRGGQTNAERLAANILQLDGFSSLDPQCPLGGPDGLKDVLCEKNGWKYVGAAYFPTTEKEYKDIKEKYIHDLDGVSKNGAQGIVFVTNQHLTPSQRKELVSFADSKSSKSIIYHLERIRVLLDSPSGYGLRLEFLDIDMSREEQMSFFSQWNRSFSDLLREHGMMIVKEISKKIDVLKAPTENLGKHIHELIAATQSTMALGAELLEKSEKTQIPIPQSGPATSNLTVETLCMLHRALLIDHPHTQNVGRLRNINIWIGEPDSSPEKATYRPPDHSSIHNLLENLLMNWRENYNDLKKSTDKQKIITELTKFHHNFLSIHPFVDGNGRIARFLMMQQANELLGFNRRIIIEDRKPYYDALMAAHSGELNQLEIIVIQALYGTESLVD